MAPLLVSDYLAATSPRMGDNGGRSQLADQAMLQEQFKAFREAVKADSGLQERLKAASDAEAVMAIANAEGYMLSVGDIQKVQASTSDEELGAVIGGRQLPYEPPYKPFVD